MTIHIYSTKSGRGFWVCGDTYPHREYLRTKGKWNGALKCWVFSHASVSQTEIEQWLESHGAVVSRTKPSTKKKQTTKSTSSKKKPTTKKKPKSKNKPTTKPSEKPTTIQITAENFKSRKCEGRGKNVWSKQQLQEFLRSHHQPVSGNKQKLCSRIESIIGPSPSHKPGMLARAKRGKPLPQPTQKKRKGTKKLPAKPSKKPKAKPSKTKTKTKHRATKVQITAANFKSRDCDGRGKTAWTKKQLQDYLRAHKQPVSGNKKTLCERIEKLHHKTTSKPSSVETITKDNWRKHPCAHWSLEQLQEFLRKRNHAATGSHEDLCSQIDIILMGKPSTKIVEKLSNPSMEQFQDLSKYYQGTKGFERFRGRYMFEWGWLLYLQEQFKDKMCVIEDPNNRGRIIGGKAPLRYCQLIKGNCVKRGLIEQPWLRNELLRCKQKGVRFTVTLLTMAIPHGYHANALILDNQSGVLSRFEPHGAATTSYSISRLDNTLTQFVKENPTLMKRYQAPPDFCPDVGPQTKERFSKKYSIVTKKAFGKVVRAEAGGYCSAWSLMFIHYRIMNPMKSNQEIHKHINRNPDELADMIRNYMAFIVKIVEPKKMAETKATKARIKVGDIVYHDGELWAGLGIVEKKSRTKAIIKMKHPYMNQLFKLVYPKRKKTLTSTIRISADYSVLQPVQTGTNLVNKGLQSLTVKVRNILGAPRRLRVDNAQTNQSQEVDIRSGLWIDTPKIRELLIKLKSQRKH